MFYADISETIHDISSSKLTNVVFRMKLKYHHASPLRCQFSNSMHSPEDPESI